MKKPSTRIKEIAEDIVDLKTFYEYSGIDPYILAILQYLDEEHAKDLELADFTKSGERKE